MKKNILSFLLLLVVGFFFNQALAQDGYTYTLVSDGYNGGTMMYDFRVQAVPFATSTSTNNPNMQSYGFTVIIPDGASYNLTTTSLIGSGSISVTPFAESSVNSLSAGAYAGHKGFLITDTLAAPIVLASTPASMTPVDIMRLSVSGDPTTGEIRIITNNSTMATNGGGSLDAYLFADMSGGNTFTNQVTTASGLSGSENFLFSVLDVDSFQLDSTSISLYPNPSSISFVINGLDVETSVSLYSLSGNQVLTIDNYKGSAIDVSGLSTGIYLVSIEANETKEVKRLMVK